MVTVTWRGDSGQGIDVSVSPDWLSVAASEGATMGVMQYSDKSREI